MLRLFVALELPNRLRERLNLFRVGVRGARWVGPENYHMTLRFIGEVEEHTAHDIDAALSTVHAPSFQVRLSGLGSFDGQGKARALWVGAERNDDLVHLRDKIESALVRAGLAPERKSKFIPHVTLARFRDTPRDRVADLIAAYNTFSADPFVVEHFTLFRSFTGNEAAHYEPLAEYPLAGSEASLFT
jgi:2'-5' RNA ligase